MFEDIRAQFFPMPLVAGFTAHALEREAFNQVMPGLMEQVFAPLGQAGAFELPDARWERLAPLRSAFAQSHHETIVFYDAEGQPVGWSWGDMLDAMTFFMTSTGILPAYRRMGIYTAFLNGFLAYLSALGYERVTSKHQLNNRPVIIAKLKVGFNIVGLDADERWGAQVGMAYLFHDDRRRGFERAFALYRVETPLSHG